MNPLQQRLASLRRRRRLLATCRGACFLVCLVLGGAVLAGVVDWFVPLPSVVRALLLVGILGSAGHVFARKLWAPLCAPADDLSLALKIEALFPELTDALASTVEFLKQPPDAAAGDSAAMRHETVQQTMRLAQKQDFEQILKRRGVFLLGLAAVGVTASAVTLLLWQTSLATTALVRLTAPFSGHTWTRFSNLQAPTFVAQNRPYVVRAQVEGIIPAQARLEIVGLAKVDKQVPIKLDAGGTGQLAAPIDMTQQKGKFRYRLWAGDAVFPSRWGWHEVEVKPPPYLVPLGGQASPQLELHYPPYTDLPSPHHLSAGTWSAEEIAGTHVVLRAMADRPLAKAWIEFRPEDPLVKTLAGLAPVAQPQLVPALGSIAGGHAVWGEMHAQFEADARQFTIEFSPCINGAYVLVLEDALGLRQEYEKPWRVLEDPLPVVHLQRPAYSQSVLPEAEVTFKVLAEDKLFALKAVYLEYRRKNHRGDWLDAAPRKLPLYDHVLVGRAVPQALAGLMPWAGPNPGLRLRPRRLDLHARWPLLGQFKEGEIIVVQVCGEDFDNLAPWRPAGRSHEIELRVVGKSELAKLLDNAMAQVQKELMHIQQKQDEALKLVKEVQAHKGKATLKQLDQLVDAEQKQKEIQERIGAQPDEGLRDDINRLQQMIKDNKLPPSQLQDHLRGLKAELDRLIQEELPQIEANLAEARKDLGSEKPQPRKEASKGPLDKARAQQEKAKQALDELVKHLGPWADLQLVKGLTRDLLQKQEALKQETQALDAKAKDDPFAKSLKEEVARKTENQQGLAGKARDLLKMMEDAAKNRKEQGDKETAKTLDAAKDALLPGAMDQAREHLEQKKFNMAMTKQEDSIKRLKKILGALEGNREEEIDKLAKKQKDAQDRLQKLAKDQDLLQKKVKQAEQEADPGKREAALKELAKEQARLQEEAQNQARALARLRAEDASRELGLAAQEMEKAAQALEEGKSPEQAQEDALDRLQQAKARLQDSEEELAREELMRIADHLKGLKERQDAAVERTRELHKKVEALKKWRTDYLKTLDGDSDNQKMLANEAAGLQEKIKDARVFAHILQKAGDAMSRAAKAMDQRKSKGLDRRLTPFEDEEWDDEKATHEAIIRAQQEASKRLDNLQESLKESLARKQPKKKDGQAGADGEPQKGIPADGVTMLAQLKALRAEQADLNERTKDFAKRHPEAAKLNEEQQAELTSLQTEQQELQRLFGTLTGPAADPKGAPK